MQIEQKSIKTISEKSKQLNYEYFKTSQLGRNQWRAFHKIQIEKKSIKNNVTNPNRAEVDWEHFNKFKSETNQLRTFETIK